MNILNIARYAVKTISVISVQTVVDNIVVATTPEVASVTQKIMTRLGGVVLSTYIGDAIGEYINKEWDEFFEKMSGVFDSETVVYPESTVKED